MPRLLPRRRHLLRQERPRKSGSCRNPTRILSTTKPLESHGHPPSTISSPDSPGSLLRSYVSCLSTAIILRTRDERTRKRHHRTRHLQQTFPTGIQTQSRPLLNRGSRPRRRRTSLRRQDRRSIHNDHHLVIIPTGLSIRQGHATQAKRLPR